MSTTSKVVLGISVILTVSTVAGVHLKQNWDHERLHAGVLRDIERLERKRENLRVLEQQISLTKELKAERDRRESGLIPKGRLYIVFS
uniref:PET117 cytochrome c oxidase chaperone n=1 Tax=Oncorhynchus kisutch TaxID=8019 RepID=A0A8C7GUR1_ONCKI